MPTAPTLSQLPDTRRALLTSLKRRGVATVDDLADDLSITVSAVRQHLVALTDGELVAYDEVRDGPGRPRHTYHLTAVGHELFPRAYGELTTELLSYVEDESPELLERVFERRRAGRVARAQERLAGLEFRDRIDELARILDEDGYLAEVTEDDDGTLHIVEHNCAIFSVAMKYGSACGTELEFIREVLPGADVRRVKHILGGAHVCAYEVLPR